MRERKFHRRARTSSLGKPKCLKWPAARLPKLYSVSWLTSSPPAGWPAQAAVCRQIRPGKPLAAELAPVARLRLIQPARGHFARLAPLVAAPAGLRLGRVR